MTNLEPIVKRLDALIALIYEDIHSQEKTSQGQLLKILRDVGLTPTDIGKIVNRKGKDISALITLFEKSQTKTIKKKKQRNQVKINEQG